MPSRTGAVAKLIGVDLFGSVIWFPVWWYTAGLKRVVLGVRDTVRYRLREYGFAIWLKNFFVPMYGQYDITGRLVSVFMRFVVLIGRIIALSAETVLYFFGVCAWAAAPVVCVVLIVLNVTKGIS